MTRSSQTPWSPADHLIAFNLYCRLPFGKLHQGNPEIIGLAKLLGRTPSSVAMKLSNFASLDPSLQARGIRGLTSISKGVEMVWADFRADAEVVAFESERLLAERMGKPVEVAAEIPVQDLPAAGEDREAMVRVRVNQGFFRRRIISAFNGRCCVTGLPAKELLVASHIVPWGVDRENRLNPRNGLCLNALHDRAFDRRLMWIDEESRVRFAGSLLASAPKGSRESIEWVTRFEGQRLLLPKDFSPDPELLRRHREEAWRF